MYAYLLAIAPGSAWVGCDASHCPAMVDYCPTLSSCMSSGVRMNREQM